MLQEKSKTWSVELKKTVCYLVCYLETSTEFKYIYGVIWCTIHSLKYMKRYQILRLQSCLPLVLTTEIYVGIYENGMKTLARWMSINWLWVLQAVAPARLLKDIFSSASGGSRNATTAKLEMRAQGKMRLKP